ncbi:MAG: hypothetical protein M3P44_15825 [Actinomycetota bacterium]|nr:hypothetical protein [Actinomycetota bacterium]
MNSSASNALPEYDAAADASVRVGYYAPIHESESPEQLFHSLGALLEHTHTPRTPYKPAERVYPWVDLHPDGRLRSIYPLAARARSRARRRDGRATW